jgi:hypothetical protein
MPTNPFESQKEECAPLVTCRVTRDSARQVGGGLCANGLLDGCVIENYNVDPVRKKSPQTPREPAP